MCLTCLPLAGDLAPTKTYASRRWVWTRNPDPTALADGKLTITCKKSAKPGAKAEDDTYDVAEQFEAVRGFRRFYAVNLASGEVYEVTLGDRGDLCTCDAGRAKVPSGCKHRHAIRAVIQAGGFDREEPRVVTREPIAVETIPGTPAIEEPDPVAEMIARLDAWEAVSARYFAAMATGEWEPCPF